jgi:hypothetical protein
MDGAAAEDEVLGADEDELAGTTGAAEEDVASAGSSRKSGINRLSKMELSNAFSFSAADDEWDTN